MKGNIESLLAEAYYNNTGTYIYPQKDKSVGFELKAGIPLITKDSRVYTNAVVYKINKGSKRTAITVISDYGNKIMFPSIEDLLCRYNIAPTYLFHLAIVKDVDMGQADLDSIFCLRDRFERQIELLTEALEGLN